MRKIVVMLAFLGLVSGLCAQDEGVRFGFQLSPTFSWMTANTGRINSSGTNLGLKMAMIGEFYFAENYAFATGLGFHFGTGGTLQFERQGCYWPNSDLDVPVQDPPGCPVLPAGTKLKYKLQYLEIPIGLKMRTNEFGYTRYFLEPAVTVGIKTQAIGSAEGRGLGDDLDKVNIKSEVGNLNLSWGLTAGLEHAISESVSLVAGLGFQLGFVDVTQDGALMYDPTNQEFSDRENSTGKINAIVTRLAIMF